MPFSVYADFQGQAASEKIVLAVIGARKRLVGWVLDSGSIYKLTNFDCERIATIEDSGTAYSAGASSSVSASHFYHDRAARILYLRASDSSNPNSRYLVLTENLYFSNVGIAAPSDHGTWSEYEVYWRDGLDKSSQFGFQLDNQNQFGQALDGSGSLALKNEFDYWQPIFEKKNFSNTDVTVYSWNRDLPITEAKILYRGMITGKSYAENGIKFTLSDRLSKLRASVQLGLLSDVVGAKITPALARAYQRRVYGEVKGHRLTNVDQVSSDTGWALAGTVSVSASSDQMTGSGTSFLSDLSPGDQILVENVSAAVTVSSIESDTSLTLSQVSSATRGGATYAVLPSLPKRYTNRDWIIAGHALREPLTTISSVSDTGHFTVNDGSDLEADSQVIINDELVNIRRQTPGNVIRLDTNLALTPSVGDTVKRLSVTNVRINSRLLTYSRDYTYDADAGTLTLDQLAEFNVAQIQILKGTLTFTSGSRTVIGVNTAFSNQLDANSWIRDAGQSTWSEVLEIISDTELRLKANSPYSDSGTALYKSPLVFNESTDVLTCDVIGATEDGTKEGVWINKAPQIVKHLLDEAGLTLDIDEDSFTESNGIAYQRVGIVIPKKFDDTSSRVYRDVIADVNKSVFGSLIQTPDFKYQYHVLRPQRSYDSSLRIDEVDALTWSITTQMEFIVKNVNFEYLKKEYDWQSSAESSVILNYSNNVANYIAKATKDLSHSTVLINENEATAIMQRLAFLLSTAYATITVGSKLQFARAQVADVVDFNHSKIYERDASTSRRKIGAIKGSSGDGFGSTVQIEDLANALTQCGTITEADAVTWEAASENDRLFHGYVTDAYGMQSNDPDTFGVNRIW